jgi:hypothetical protein
MFNFYLVIKKHSNAVPSRKELEYHFAGAEPHETE